MSEENLSSEIQRHIAESVVRILMDALMEGVTSLPNGKRILLCGLSSNDWATIARPAIAPLTRAILKGEA